MSRYAVLVLPFFIVSVISIEPLITNSFSGSIPPKAEENFNKTLNAEFLAQNYPVLNDRENQAKKTEIVKTLITAYSSSVNQTDDTPFITASGSYVRPGIIAANFLPFGAIIRIPEIFGNQIFVVEDRLHERNGDRIDIWMPTEKEALEFGVKIGEIEIL
jgi:3D (Asp-Asp-Asp) domain-containing protein